MDTQKPETRRRFTQEELDDIDTFARLVMAAKNEPLEWKPAPKPEVKHTRPGQNSRKKQVFILAAVTVILIVGIFNLISLIVS